MRQRILLIFPALFLVLALPACTTAASGAAGESDTPPAVPAASQTEPADVLPAPAETSESADSPEWFRVDLTDVNTGSTFTIDGLRGKVVLLETMAMWCPKCLSQQKEVKALHEQLGTEQDWVGIALDIDPNEDAEALKAYAGRNGFDWIYAIAPPEVYREIGQLYGEQFLNPPSTPMLIIDRDGTAHPLPFGTKSADALQDFLDPFLSG